MFTALREGLRPYTQAMREYALKADELRDMPAEYVKDDFFRPIWQLGTPEKFGSIGLRGKNNQTYFGESALELAIWTEEIAYGDPAMLLTLPGPQLVGPLISKIGEEHQQETFFLSFLKKEPVWASFALTEPSCGSDLANIQTRAEYTQDFYKITGEKKYVGNGTRASWVCIFAKIADKKGTFPIQCFLFNHNDLNQIGVKRTEINTLGMRSAKLAHFVLDRASISRQHLLGYTKSPLKRGFTGAAHVFYRMRPSVSALAVGVSKAAIDYVKENIQLSASSEIEIARLRWKIKKAQHMIYRAAHQADQQIFSQKVSSMAKWYANCIVYEVTRKCIHFTGPDLPNHPLIEKWMRDARMIEFMEGTTNIHKNMIGKELFKK
ncbi:acyl-CoA dehydrogenase family protein [Bacillus halotolerans]|uniref:acyl-CoA dehydrogenase family protein n=1 Tax=Bacillus halotolerans TaxID=260554 RepID=UPI00403FA00F